MSRFVKHPKYSAGFDSSCSLGLWVNGETPFLMRSDLEPDFARVFGITRDDRLRAIEMEKLSFSYSGPLGRAETLLHERFHYAATS